MMNLPPVANLLPIEQLWYTWSGRGLESVAAGYRVRACSPGLSSEGRLEQMRPYLRYQLPAEVNPDSFTVEEAPRTLALVRSGGESLLLHKVYAGRDGSGRPGNYFVHLLAGLPLSFGAEAAICFWRYHDALLWRTSDDPDHGVVLPSIAAEELERRLEKRQPLAFGPGVVPRGPGFIPLSEQERDAALECLPWLLLAFFDQQAYSESLKAQREEEKMASQLRRGGKEALASESQVEIGAPPVFLVATPDQAAWLVWALALLLPPALRQRLTFSTYEESDDLSSSRIIRRSFALVATWPGRPERAASCLSERFYREAWTFNLFTGLHTTPRELPEARDFVELACEGFREGDLSRVEQLHRDLEGHVADLHSFLQAYRRWKSNQHVLSLEKIIEIIQHHPGDWSQLMVRRQIVQRLSDDQQGEALLERALPDLRRLAVLRLRQRQLDQALVRFENEVRELWRGARVSASARVRLLLTLEALGAGRGLLVEAVDAVLADGAAQRVLLERPDLCSRVLACAAHVLSRREVEYYREVVGGLLQGYRDWEDCRSLLPLELPRAWHVERLRLFRRVLMQLATGSGTRLPLEDVGWARLLQFLEQARADNERQEILSLAAVLLRDRAAPAFRLLGVCCQLSPPPTEDEMGELLRHSGLLQELNDLEQGRVGAAYRQQRLLSYAEELSYHARLYLETRLPSLEDLCLHLFTLFCLFLPASPTGKDLLSQLFLHASDALRERLLLVWPTTEVEAVASLVWDCASEGDPFFLRKPVGLFYHQAICRVLKPQPKRRLLAVWAERLRRQSQPQPFDLYALLASSELTPDERAWLLEEYGPSYLADPDYASCAQLHYQLRLYLENLGLEDLQRPETRRFLEVLAAPRIPLSSRLASLAQSWLSIAEALTQRQATPELDKALSYLQQVLDDQHYTALFKKIADKLKIKHLKLEQKKQPRAQYALEQLKPESQPMRRSAWWRLPWLPRRGLRRRL